MLLRRKPSPPADEAAGGSSGGGEDAGRPVRPGTYLIGLVCVAAVCVIVSFAELVASRGGSVDAVLLGATHMPPGAIAGLIGLLIVSTGLRRISPRLALTPPELIIIYFMMVSAALISSFGLAAQLLPNLIALNYFANPANQWRPMFFEHIPRWLVPWDPAGPEAQPVSKQFYEGLRFGEAIPWGSWIVPICAWLLLAHLLFFLMACVATLFRRQWVDSERLTFPLVQLPIEMTESSRTRFFQQKAMWVGFAIPVLLHGLNGLHQSVPQAPSVSVWWLLNEYFVNKPFVDVYDTFVVVALSMVGFAFLLPLDVSFSFWFFLLLFRFQDVVASMWGIPLAGMPLYPAPAHAGFQSAGAFVVIAFSMVWLARPHFRLVIKRVFDPTAAGAEADEFMSYRTAFWGMIISFVLIVAWCAAAGITPWIAALMLFAFVFIIVLVLTRAVSEIGLLMLQPVFRPMDLWAIAAPRAAIGAGNLTVLALLNGVFFRDPRTLMPAFMDSMKGADLVGARRRSVAIGMLIGIFAAALIAVTVQLWIIYRMGGLALNQWFFRHNPVLYFNEAGVMLQGDPGITPSARAAFGAGAVVTAALFWLRTRFWWWPFHPLGYALGAAWPAIVYWSAFFVGWACKALIMRYGGARLYARARPLFLGLILGEFSAGIFWTAMTGLFGLLAPSIPIT